MNNNCIRAGVFSGGGAFGAFTVGTLAALKRDYAIVAGVSTGALFGPLAALGEYERLKVAYTVVNQSDILNYNPFRKDGKISVPKVLWRVLTGKATLGESQTLRRTIDKFLYDSDFQRLQLLNKQVIVACQETSQEPGAIRYFNSLECEPDDFKDWMWASANFPIVCSILYKDGGEYCDAGLTESQSLCKVIEMGAREIDVFLHRARPVYEQKEPVKNLFHNAARLFTTMRHAIVSDDLQTGLLQAQLKGCKVNVYWLPRKLAANSLIFDQAQMTAWYEEGYRLAFDEERIDRYDFARTSDQNPDLPTSVHWVRIWGPSPDGPIRLYE